MTGSRTEYRFSLEGSSKITVKVKKISKELQKRSVHEK